ncbi:ArsA-related P-loop ATPase [Acetohalobium arabaticum]|uniref:Cobyrinic acid ac-diamide synthase n=1 Tax=Acetohalobium arabaticum (strain ATCC 49924 / DSM 5501 / Z-7288) TaxID=574087 RepID=D9QPS4_ACEAZ|nr:ArsA-related P-loop ATPase [Acetohalobium arabaticum]ADL12515.1 Cobyrinic acid ac-diamide synthase [Acetohalobium arabaticum DSM 5501]
MKIAVSGKGGVGKTTISAGLARIFSREGEEVIALDTDSSPNLMTALGAKDTSVTPLSEMDELIEEKTGVEPGSGYGQMFRLNFTVDDILDRFGVECDDGVQLLVAGSIRQGGSGCFCPENALIKKLMEHYLKEWDQTLIMDMEAGIEHLGRGTTENVDVLLTVVEPSLRSVKTAARINRLAEDIGIENNVAILNKMKEEREKEIIEDKLDIPLIYTIPYNDSVNKADLKGNSVFNEDEELMNMMAELKQKL